MAAMAIEATFRSEERFTQSQFRAWLEARPPRDGERCELLRGRVVMSPPARPRHGRVEVAIASLLDRHVASLRLGLVFGASTGFELPSGDTLSPDVSFVAKGRLEGVSLDEFFRLVPDLVVEVLSPTSVSRDRVEKLAIYAGNRVEETWIVDPRRRTVEVYRLRGAADAEPEVVTTGRIRSGVLPRLEASVEDLFAGLD